VVEAQRNPALTARRSTSLTFSSFEFHYVTSRPIKVVRRIEIVSCLVLGEGIVLSSSTVRTAFWSLFIRKR